MDTGRQTAQLVLTIGSLVMLVVLIWVGRKRGWTSGWDEPGMALSWSPRRTVNRQVLGRAPVDPDRMPVLRSTARAMVASKNKGLMIAPTTIMAVGVAIGFPNGTLYWILAAVMTVAGIGIVLQDRRRARVAADFLRRHPEPRVDPAREPSEPSPA